MELVRSIPYGLANIDQTPASAGSMMRLSESAATVTKATPASLQVR